VTRSRRPFSSGARITWIPNARRVIESEQIGRFDVEPDEEHNKRVSIRSLCVPDAGERRGPNAEKTCHLTK
jgi:hypothetical protein